jgi:hypothetical protein
MIFVLYFTKAVLAFDIVIRKSSGQDEIPANAMNLKRTGKICGEMPEILIGFRPSGILVRRSLTIIPIKIIIEQAAIACVVLFGAKESGLCKAELT